MHSRSPRRLVSPLALSFSLALALAACGGTVVFEEDGGSDGGGGSGDGSPTGSGGAPSANGVTTGSPVTTTNGVSSGPSPAGVTVGGVTVASVTVGQAIAVSTGTGSCDQELFGDPDLDACSRANCCAEMAACLDDISSCFDDSGQFDPSQPNGQAFLSCLENSGCLTFDDGQICDSGIGFSDSDPETLELARCLSENCCAEFEFCTSDGADADSCIECINGETKDGDLCSPALECAAEFCQKLN